MAESSLPFLLAFEQHRVNDTSSGLLKPAVRTTIILVLSKHVYAKSSCSAFC